MNCRNIAVIAASAVLALSGVVPAEAAERAGTKSCGSLYLHVHGSSRYDSYLYASVPGGYQMEQHDVWAYGTGHSGSWRVWHTTREYPSAAPFCDMV